MDNARLIDSPSRARATDSAAADVTWGVFENQAGTWTKGVVRVRDDVSGASILVTQRCAN